MKGQIQRVATGLVSALIAGCASLQFDPPRRASTHEEVGSIHFSVISVGDWDSYKESLQPKFGLKSADALALSMTSTRTLEESLLDAVRFAAALEGGRDTTTSTRTTQRDEDIDDATPTTETISTTRTETRGPLNNAAPAAPTSNALPSDLRAGIGTLGAAPSSEPVLRYQNANAIYQAVHLLDRHISDAVKREGYRAHVVTIQVSVLPTGRRRPYDAYANVTFRASEGGIEPIIPFSDSGASLFGTLAPERPGGEPTVKPVPRKDSHVVVVPLISTDQLETTIHSRQTDQIQQLALSLALLQGNVGLGTDFQRFSEKLRRALGRDVNSLLTVGRLTDDTVRIRMGAMQAVDTDYALVPRTHLVSLLLLTESDASDDTPLIKAMMATEFRDVESGHALRTRSMPEIEKEARRILRQFDERSARKMKAHELAALIRLINASPKEVFEELVDYDALRDHSEQIRLSLATLLVGSQFGSTEFTLPAPKPDARTTIETPSQPYALLDDGKKAVMTMDAGGETLVASKLASIPLSIGTRVQMLPSGVSIDPALQRATITFATTKRVKPGVGEPVAYGGAPIHIVDVEEEKKPGAGVLIAVGAQIVWSDQVRGGGLVVRVDFPEKDPAKQVVLTVSGADVLSAQCVPACTEVGGTYVVTADAAVKFSLANLGTSLTVSGKGEKEADPVSITLPVVSLPPPEREPSRG